MRRYIEKTWLIFLASAVLGLLFPGFAPALEPYLIYLLMLMVTVSVSSIRLSQIASRTRLWDLFLLFAANYLLLSSLILALSFLLIKNPDYLSGMIIMAAVPCAIAVVPFTKLLKGDVLLAAGGLIINYLASIVITPMMIWLFFRQSADLLELFRMLFLLVIVPLLVSYLLRKAKVSLEKHDRLIINIIFLLTIYGFIGLNRDTLIGNFLSLKEVMVVLFARTAVIMTVVFLMSKKMRLSIPLTVFSGYKNLGYSALLSLALISREAALPSVFGILFEMISFLYLQKLSEYT